MHEYSENRLLGEHVPYAVEAYPEGSGRHLSAESALYCRVITDGLFGINETEKGEDLVTEAHLPSELEKATLKRIYYRGKFCDMEI